MATKKRKADQEDDLLLSQSSSDSKPLRPTLYFPITDDAPSAAPPQPQANDRGGHDDGYGAGEDDLEQEEEGQQEEEDEVDVGALLSLLSRDQLISLLCSAASYDPRTLAEIHSVADADPAHRKLFVHGLGWDTTSDGLRAAFTRYGDIDEARVISDKLSGRSKGYGFVLFRRRAAACRALRSPQKLIGSRMTSCQLAAAGPTAPSSLHHHNQQQHQQSPNPRSVHNPNPTPNHGPNYADNLPRKIYVANVHSDVDVSRLYNFFAQYGEIEEGPLGLDRQTGKPKGFALFVYKTMEGARRALEEPVKNFEGHVFNCQRATDGRSKAAAVASAPSSAAPPINMPVTTPGNGVAGFDASGYGGLIPDLGMAQQAAMLGPALMGVGGGQQAFGGQGMQPNAAMIAMLAAAMQNPAGFGFTPAMLASMNPGIAAAAFSAGAQQVVPTSAVAQSASIQGLGAANMGYQNAGFQGLQGFQAPPGFQNSAAFQGSVSQQGSAGGAGSYQGGSAGQARAPTGSMGGY